MMLLLNRKTAEQKLATFLSQLAQRYASRGFSASEFRLTMTRSDIGNYLGLTVETISRLLSKLDKEQLIQVNGKLRDTLHAPRGAAKDALEAQALASPKVQAILAGATPKKVIVVPDRLVNIVA